MTRERHLVVVPAFNEEATIERVVRGALRHARVCVVDDGSTDRTAAVLAGIEGVHVIRHRTNVHVARSVLDGMAYALEQGVAYVVTMDAGLSHDPDELPRLLEAAPAGLVIGARSARTSQGVPWYRRSLSAVGTMLMNRVLSGHGCSRSLLTDCTSGYRRYSREAMQLLIDRPLRSRAFDFLLESLAVIARAGLTIREVPVSYRFSNSSLTPRVTVEALRQWWMIRRELR